MVPLCVNDRGVTVRDGDVITCYTDYTNNIHAYLLTMQLLCVITLIEIDAHLTVTATIKASQEIPLKRMA